MAFKNKQVSPKPSPDVQDSKPLLFASSEFSLYILFEFYQKHFPHLPPGGRWIHILERHPDPALPEVVM